MKTKTEIIDYLGLDVKKENLKQVLFSLFAIPIGFFCYLQGGFVWAVPAAVFIIIGIQLYFLNDYQSRFETLDRKHSLEFVEAFHVFNVFINQNFNVYNAFQETINYVSPWVCIQIENLLLRIDTDKSLAPYIAFSHKFSPIVVEQLMMTVYQIGVEGADRIHLGNFAYLFDQFSLQQQEDETMRLEAKMDGLNMMPLIGAGILSLNLLVGVVSIIGGMISEL
jgi:hypothetical protein